jgi:large subunit ribosomal protein L18
MANAKVRELKRIGRHQRIRKKITGTSDQPRLCVHRSLNNLYVQLVDDSLGNVLFGMSTREKSVSQKIKYGGNVNAASVLGEAFAAVAQKKGIKKVCFDRGGYLYHGRVKAFAEAARKGGMEF